MRRKEKSCHTVRQNPSHTPHNMTKTSKIDFKPFFCLPYILTQKNQKNCSTAKTELSTLYKIITLLLNPEKGDIKRKCPPLLSYYEATQKIHPHNMTREKG